MTRSTSILTLALRLSGPAFASSSIIVTPSGCRQRQAWAPAEVPMASAHGNARFSVRPFVWDESERDPHRWPSMRLVEAWRVQRPMSLARLRAVDGRDPGREGWLLTAEQLRGRRADWHRRRRHAAARSRACSWSSACWCSPSWWRSRAVPAATLTQACPAVCAGVGNARRPRLNVGPRSAGASCRRRDAGAGRRSAARLHVVCSARRSARRRRALTFDDGPGPYTPQILDVLGRITRRRRSS